MTDVSIDLMLICEWHGNIIASPFLTDTNWLMFVIIIFII